MINDILTIIDLNFIFLVFIGSLAGFFIGAMPGLSVTMATALLVSLTFTWEAKSALALIMGVYVVGVYSGAITAILVNIPGAPSSIATTLDGYPLAKKGKGLIAIRVTTYYSFLGTIFGILMLAVSARHMAKLALAFTPMDYFLLALFGITTVGSLTSKDFLKGLIVAFIGVFISMIGIDPMIGISRFTYGSINLQRGISVIPVLIGLFGFSELLMQLYKGEDDPIEEMDIGGEKIGLKEILSHWKLGLKSSLIGAVIGALPGAGGPVASLIAYDHGKRTTRNNKVAFGEGAVEGLVASEAANNACIGGALIPMLTLGIPGDAVTAVILSAFYIHGLRPGPLLFSETPEMFAIIIAGGVVGSISLLILGLTIAPLVSRLLNISKSYLLPIVALLCIIGSYGASTNSFDILLMLIFGVVGFLMRINGYPIAPMVLGLVLGGLMDSNFRRAMALLSSSDNIFLDIFTKPITVILMTLVLISVISNFISIGYLGKGKN